MRLLQWFAQILWHIARGTVRQFLLYIIPPGVAVLVVAYVSSQVLGYDVEGCHSRRIADNGTVTESWLFLTPEEEGCRQEVSAADGRMVYRVCATFPVGTFLTKRGQSYDFLKSAEEFNYHPNGNLECHGSVEERNGQLHSLWTYCRDNGTKLATVETVDGQAHGWMRNWHENGRLLYEQRNEHGTTTGVCRLWNDRGEAISEGHLDSDGNPWNGVFPLPGDMEITRLAVYQDGQQVEELEFTPDMPPVHWQGESRTDSELGAE